MRTKCLRPAIITAVGLILLTGLSASADNSLKTTRIFLEADGPTPIYRQADTKHPSPIFLVCAGDTNSHITISGSGADTFVLPPTECLFLSDTQLSAHVSSEAKDAESENDRSLERATAWMDDRIADLESKSEPTEHEVMLLKSLKERQGLVGDVYVIKRPAFITVTLVR